VVGGLFGAVVNGRNLYNWLTGSPSPPARTSVISPTITVPTAELVARCKTVEPRWGLEALIKREVEQREADLKTKVEALKKALPPRERTPLVVTWLEERPYRLNVLDNGWVFNGYTRCEISNTGAKPAKDVRLIAPGMLVTFYDGSNFSKNWPSELQLGEIRPEMSRTVEVFSEQAGNVPPSADDLKLNYSEGGGKVTFKR